LIVGNETKRDAAARDNHRLRQAIADYRKRHPDHSRRTMARNLIGAYPGRTGSIDALVKRISRLTTK
jgi:hypothetical protein